MTNNLRFIETYVDNQYWHYKYQFKSNRILTNELYKEIYDWCIENFDGNIGWHMANNGVVIFDEKDAMAFKIRWS